MDDSRMIFGPFLGKCLKYFDETWTEVRQKDFEAGAGSRLRIGGPMMLGLFSYKMLQTVITG